MKFISILTLVFFTCFHLTAEKKGSYRIDEPGIKVETFEKHIGPITKFELTPNKDGYLSHENDGKAVSWEVYVPENYNPSKPSGILSYISPGNGGKLPGKWKELMDKHNLIWIAANNSGNFYQNDKKKPYYNYWRTLLSLEGVTRIKAAYKIDSDRVFLSGFSGGGRVSSYLITERPEVYKGAIFICGCNTWSNKLDRKILKEAAKGYYVHLTGTKDFNLPGTKSVHNFYKKNGFKDNSKLMIIDGLGHSTPDTADYDTAIQFLDTPKELRKKEALKLALQTEKRKKYAEAMNLFAKAAAYGSKEAEEKYQSYQNEISSMLKTAKDAEAVRNFVLSINTYDALVKKFGKELGEEAYSKSKALKKDKQIITEIKAQAYFLKILRAIKKGNTNDKVKAALKKVIDTCPESHAAKLAKAELDKI
ncbi:MAG: prolyl oligopeptidase family serine peptidase, partial [Lentisphaeraceae bacterium]|nr:prolyl oligopeptidase family serine peptidase [Lentisphaeraceae bacterium]